MMIFYFHFSTAVSESGSGTPIVTPMVEALEVALVSSIHHFYRHFRMLESSGIGSSTGTASWGI